MSFLRTILILGRVSNLPTVWSNCLAGWWLGGDHHSDRLPFVLIGATFLIVLWAGGHRVIPRGGGQFQRGLSA